MNLLIVTYDALNDDDGEHGKAVLKYIKARSEWAKLSDSSYLLWTSKTPSTVIADLKQCTDSGLTCFVCPVSEPMAKTRLPKKAADLLERHLD